MIQSAKPYDSSFTRHSAQVDWSQLYEALSEPFPASELRYRPGAINRDQTKAQALVYVNVRAYEDRLNRLVPGNWQVEFRPWGEHRVICDLAIFGVNRSSTGEALDGLKGSQGTKMESQAFRRACAKFGLGRYLYALKAHWVDYDADKKQLVLDDRPRKPQKPVQQPEPLEGIGPERAAGMHRALRTAGLPPKEHEAFASKVLGRRVSAFLELSDQEARRVWEAAQRAKRDNKSVGETKAA